MENWAEAWSSTCLRQRVLSSLVFGLSRTLGATGPPANADPLIFWEFRGRLFPDEAPLHRECGRAGIRRDFLRAIWRPASNRVDRSPCCYGCRCLRNEGFVGA